MEAINRANPAVAKPSRAACALRGAEARIIRTRRGERWPATPAAFLLRLAEPRSIVVLARDQRSSYEDRPSGRWPAIYCCWAFLVRTRDGIILRAAQCCTDRRRRGRRSLRYRPCLVRIAVAGPQDHRRGGGYGPLPISMSASMIRRSYYFPFAFGPRRGRLKSGPFRAEIRTRNLPISRTKSCRCRRRVRDKDAPRAFLSRNSNEPRRAKQLDRRSRPSWWFSLTV